MIPAWGFYILFAVVAVVALIIFGVLIALASATGVTPEQIEKNSQNLKIAVYTIATIILIFGAGGAILAIVLRAKEEDKKKQQAAAYQRISQGETPVFQPQF
jgi:peptidoglycan/LPS O-acetylase OafA/YrhL